MPNSCGKTKALKKTIRPNLSVQAPRASSFRTTTYARKHVRRYTGNSLRKNARRYGRKHVRRYARKNAEVTCVANSHILYCFSVCCRRSHFAGRVDITVGACQPQPELTCFVYLKGGSGRTRNSSCNLGLCLRCAIFNDLLCFGLGLSALAQQLHMILYMAPQGPQSKSTVHSPQQSVWLLCLWLRPQSTDHSPSPTAVHCPHVTFVASSW